MANKIVREIIHAKGIDIGIYTKDFENEYMRRKTDLENHLHKTYDKIDEAEELLVSAKAKKRSLLADKITQKMMATLYDVGLPTINEHIKKIHARLHAIPSIITFK